VEWAVNAGIDMFMEDDNWERFLTTLEMLADSGKVPHDRIDDAVRRILRVKFEAGLFKKSLQAVSPETVVDYGACCGSAVVRQPWIKFRWTKGLRSMQNRCFHTASASPRTRGNPAV
jgi:beta-glucosidase-like glycosyl hydrolase